VCWLLAALVLFSQGWLRGVNLVALIACLLIGLWAVNFVWVLARRRFRGLRVRRRVDEAAFARQPFTVCLELTNPTGRRQPGVRVEDRSRFHRNIWFLPVVRPGEVVETRFPVTLPRRGRHRWAPLSVRTGYPFGLYRRELEIDTGDSTIVLPSLGRLHRANLRRLLVQQSQYVSTSRRPVKHLGAQTEFHGLREFRSGDSPRWIHWRTSARVGELMVREFEEPPLDNLVLLFEAWLPQPLEELRRQYRLVQKENVETIRALLAAGPEPPPDKRRAKEQALARREEPFRRPLELLELGVSLAATICWEWARQTGAALALGVADRKGEVRVTEAALARVIPLLEKLALVEGGPEPDANGLVEGLLAAPLPPGPVLLVTTRGGGGLADLVASRLRRPVVTVDVGRQPVDDLFDWDAAPDGGA
jgi:hypothetical protein